MFGTFRKHSTWLWGIIIAAMAVSLVYWTGNRGTGPAGSGSGNYGSIGGEAITQQQLSDAAAEARLQYFTTRGNWPGTDAERQGWDLNLEAYKRLFIVLKQKELGIHISDEQVARVAANDLRAMARGGAPVSMSMFEQNILKPARLTLVDYERFLRHQLGMQQLITAVTVGGKLVTEKEARAIFERENRERSAQVVFFLASNYLAGVQSTPEALSQFYSNQVARYRLPDRIQVSYVEFKATNYWAEAAQDMAKMTNLTALIDAEYTRRGGTNYYTDKTPDQAKDEIKNQLHEELALRAANKVANAFADPILSADKIRAEALAEQAMQDGLTVQVTAPFDRNSLPAGMNVSDQFVTAAFGLRDDEPVTGPLITRDAVYVIARNKEIPSELQSYDQVKDRVATDFKQMEALKAARSAANAFVARATNAIAEGKAFTSVCSEAKVTPMLLPPFSQNTRSLEDVEPYMSLQQFKQVAFSFGVGQVSPAVPIMDGAVVTYIQSELDLAESKVNAELPAFMEMFRQARQQEAFEEWFAREAPRALANTPVVGPKPSELNEAAGAAN